MTPASNRPFVVAWRDLARWDIKSARAAVFRLAHPSFRPLSEFAEEATELVRPFDEPDKEWPVYGVNNTEGVFFSHYQRGAEFNAPYKRIAKDWFFHNPTRANVGSLGRVPDVPPDAITSPEYQVWRIKKGLSPEFVELLIQTRFFLDLVECHRVGAVKERLFVQNLLEIPIPVLDAAQQRSIVSHWRGVQKEAEIIDRRAERIRADVDVRFLQDLGLKPLPKTARPKAFAVQWGDLFSWSVASAVRNQQLGDLTHGQYPTVRGTDCLAEIKHGCAASPAKTRTALRVLKISAVTRGYLRLDEYKYAVDRERFRKEFDLRTGDVLLCRTNGTLALVGMASLVTEDVPDTIFPDKIIRVRTKPNLSPEYLWHVLKTPYLRAQIEVAARTGPTHHRPPIFFGAH